MEARVVGVDGQGDVAGVERRVDLPVAPVGRGEVHQALERGNRDPGVNGRVGTHRQRRHLQAGSKVPVKGAAVDRGRLGLGLGLRFGRRLGLGPGLGLGLGLRLGLGLGLGRQLRLARRARLLRHNLAGDTTLGRGPRLLVTARDGTGLHRAALHRSRRRLDLTASLVGPCACGAGTRAVVRNRRGGRRNR